MSKNSDGTSVIEKKICRKRKRLYDPVVIEEQTNMENVPLPLEILQIDAPLSESSCIPFAQEKSKKEKADVIIMDYVMWSAGVALIPIPFIDIAAILAVELKMVKKLSELYEIPFSEHKGKTLIASLIGGAHSGLFTKSFLKFIPAFGLIGVILPMAAINGGITYAIGKVFLHHFEAGGTLLNFDPSKMKDYFAKQYKDGRLTISGLNKSK